MFQLIYLLLQLFWKQGTQQAAASIHWGCAVLSDILYNIPGLSTACVEHGVLLVVCWHEVKCGIALQKIVHNQLSDKSCDSGFAQRTDH